MLSYFLLYSKVSRLYVYIYPLFSEKAMAPHSSTLTWKIPWMEEPGRLQSMGSLRIGHNWATSLSLFTFMHWRRKWQPTPVFLPGESQGWGSLVGCLGLHRVGHDWSDLAVAVSPWLIFISTIHHLSCFLTSYLYSVCIPPNQEKFKLWSEFSASISDSAFELSVRITQGIF